MPIRIIGLDADDTLWHNESIFRATQARFYELLSPFGAPDFVEARLAEIEHRNLGTYGYGAKGFTLSMLETALSVSHGRVDTAVIAEILDAGRGMTTHPVEPLPGVVEALEALASRTRLVLITKGDLFHQEAKLAASGLGSYFAGVEIVSDKTPATYERIFRRYDAAPGEALMAGNSVRSDILPVLEAGGYAALVPYPLVWSHEAAEAPASHPRYRELATLAELPDWVSVIG